MKIPIAKNRDNNSIISHEIPKELNGFVLKNPFNNNVIEPFMNSIINRDTPISKPILKIFKSFF